MVEIVLQPLDTNADFVVLIEWLVPDGGRVEAGAPVCMVETSKATVDITTPAAGVLAHHAEAGHKIAVGTVIASVSASGEKKSLPPPVHTDAAEERVSRRARELMTRYALSIDEFPGTGYVTLADVERRVAERDRDGRHGKGGIFPRLEGIDLQGVTFPDGSGDVGEGKMDPSFLERVRAAPDALRNLPEHERIALLREHGAAIGVDVRLGDGALVYAPQVVLRDGASIAENATVWCGERFVVGSLARLGANLTLRCQQAVIGSGVDAAHDIVIGGGGHRDPWAVITIGDDCYLGSDLHLNPCRPVIIGRNVFVTNGTTVLTHNVGQSYIDGHENRFAPVVLEDESVVGFNTVIYPGSRLGKAAVIGSNSYVVGAIPPGKLAMGVPARVIGEAQQTPTPARRESRVKEILSDLHRLLAAKGYHVLEFNLAAEGTLRVMHEGKEFGLALRANGRWEPLDERASWVVWTLTPATTKDERAVVIDLVQRHIAGSTDRVWTDTVREYLRKRGVKLRPGPWRYGGGLI